MERRITHWFIDEESVLNGIENAGYNYLKTTDNNWYDTDLPIVYNDSTTIKGVTFYSHGTHLSLHSKDQIEVEKVKKFDLHVFLQGKNKK